MKVVKVKSEKVKSAYDNVFTLHQEISEESTLQTMSTLSISYSSTTGTFGSQTAANDVESSSDDEESVYTFAEALQS